VPNRLQAELKTNDQIVPTALRLHFARRHRGSRLQLWNTVREQLINAFARTGLRGVDSRGRGRPAFSHATNYAYCILRLRPGQLAGTRQVYTRPAEKR